MALSITVPVHCFNNNFTITQVPPSSPLININGNNEITPEGAKPLPFLSSSLSSSCSSLYGASSSNYTPSSSTNKPSQWFRQAENQIATTDDEEEEEEIVLVEMFSASFTSPLLPTRTEEESKKEGEEDAPYPLPVALTRDNSSFIIEDHCDSFAASLIAAAPSSAAAAHVAVPPSVVTLSVSEDTKKWSPLLGEGKLPPRTLSQFLLMREEYFKQQLQEKVSQDVENYKEISKSSPYPREHTKFDDMIYTPPSPCKRRRENFPYANGTKHNPQYEHRQQDYFFLPSDHQLRRRQVKQKSAYATPPKKSATHSPSSSSTSTTTSSGSANSPFLRSPAEIKEEKEFVYNGIYMSLDDGIVLPSVLSITSLVLFLIYLFFYW